MPLCVWHIPPSVHRTAEVSKLRALPHRGITSWDFKRNDTTFSILVDKREPTFSISYSTSPGSSTSFIYGNYQQVQDGYRLTSDSMQLLIKGDHLFDFGPPGDSVKLNIIRW